MPELPEIETIVRDLRGPLERKTFLDVIVHDAFILRPQGATGKRIRLNAEDFVRRLKNQIIDKIVRRGKAVVIHLAPGGFLVIQPMMTGQLVMDGLEDKHTRIRFVFSDGTKLLYNDQRRFGQVRLVEELGQIKHFNILGPEPFSEEFTPVYVQQAFQKTARPVKNVLLDHTFVAGIGNIYASEILFRSRVSPRRLACRVSLAEVKTIHRFIIEVLKEAIAYRGSSMRNYRDGLGEKGRFNERLAVYARQGLPCPRCQGPIQRIIQSGRSSFYCKQCQK